ncbi:hypothetical protein B0H19DRAFT_1073515 [Mycena capillaripes]|nr:hypothetical protein B0H19DRAFT_1073515 [Mycena capillaripes]
MPEPELFPCSGCGKTKPGDQFKMKATGRARTCIPCQSRSRNAKRDNKENEEIDVGADDEEEDDSDLGVLGLTEFLDALTRQDDNLRLEARVDITSVSGTRKAKSDAIVALIWGRMKYRFTYHSSYPHWRKDLTRFMYHCVQNQARQNAPKKSQREGVKHRDKISMDTFKCHGWLHITVGDSNAIAFVKISRLDDHIPYWSIDVPTDVMEYVRNNIKSPLK